jgi:uncharacterized protein
MGTTTTWVRKHRLTAFFTLAYALSWSLIPFDSFLPTGALIAAVIVIAIADGRPGFRELGSRIIRWRVHWIWYVAALGVPIAIHVVTITANAELSSAAIDFDQFNPWYSLVVVFASRLVDPLNGPVAEEPSWRGFAQPTLQQTHSPLVATLILATLVTVWHLPLFFISEFELQPIEALPSFAVTFFYAWLFNRADGSVLITLLAHAAEGTVETSNLWPDGADADRMILLNAVAWTVVAIAVVVADRQLWLKRPTRQ